MFLRVLFFWGGGVLSVSVQVINWNNSSPMWPVLIGIVKPYSLTHSTLGLHLFACFAQDRPFTLCMESRPYYIQWDKKYNQVQGQSNELVRCVQHMFLLCSCVVKSNISVVVLSFWLWRFPLMPLLFYTVIHGRVPSSAKITAESKVNQYSSITCRTFAWNSCRRKALEVLRSFI